MGTHICRSSWCRWRALEAIYRQQLHQGKSHRRWRKERGGLGSWSRHDQRWPQHQSPFGLRREMLYKRPPPDAKEHERCQGACSRSKRNTWSRARFMAAMPCGCGCSSAAPRRSSPTSQTARSRSSTTGPSTASTTSSNGSSAD